MTNNTIPLLDHGYIKLCESWGSGGDESGDLEAGIIAAARQSTQGSFRGWERDEKLLAYLYNNKHSTPFEFAGAVIEVQCPLFCMREWHRHRTQSYNEMSARYEPLPDLYYIPSLATLMFDADKDNKQAGTTKDSRPLTESAALAFQRIERANAINWEAHYKWALSAGIPKERARIGMPVNHYSRMRASANLRNWLSFMTLRQDPKAQFEIRVFADALHELLRSVFPRTIALFDQGQQT